MIYGFSSRDVARLRNLLAAYERGRVRIDAPSQEVPDDHQCDSTLGNVGSSIPAGQVGSAYIVDLDTSTPTPGQTTETLVPSIPVFNPGSSALAAGTYLLTREPSQGYYVPSSVGGSSGGGSSFSGAGYYGYNGVTVAANTNTSLSMSSTSMQYDVGSYGASLTTPATGYYRGTFTIFFNGGNVSTTPYWCYAYVPWGAPFPSFQQTATGYADATHNVWLQISWDCNLNSGISIPAPTVNHNASASIFVQVWTATIERIG